MGVDSMISDILRREGGFVNHPNDRGGPTNYGVTQRALSTWRGHPASVDDVRDLTEAEAREIYRRRYFTGPRLDLLPDALQSQVFDMAVNHGPVRAVKFVQAVCNAAGFGPLEEDGIMGPRTAEVAGQALVAMAGYMHNALVDERLAFYHRLAMRDPRQQVFLKGWTRRAEEFRVEVV